MSEATRALVDPLRDAEADLALVVESRNVLLPDYVRVLAGDVWPTIRRRFEELRRVLQEAGDQYDAKLTNTGLTGLELRMKLDAYRVAREKARSALQIPTNPMKLIRKLFKSLLGYLNVWLGSLVAVLGMGHAVKEFKEVLEQGVEDMVIFEE